MKFLVIGALLASGSIFAQTYDYSKKIGLGGSFGYNTPIFGNPLNTLADDDISWGFHARYHLDASSGLELGHTRHELDDTILNVKVTDILYFKRLNALSRFTPVVGAGLGVVDIGHYEPKSLKLAVKLRAGAEYALTEAFSLGLNLDYQHINKMFFAKNLPSRNGHLLAGRVGITYYFGGAKETVATTQAASVVENTKSTKDTRDTDGDGIVDSKDKCPNTAKGVKVNAYGCAEKEKATVNVDVKFDSGKSTLNSEYTNDLKDLADFMKEHPKAKIEIQGHTDNSGSKAINKKLSQERANAVKTYLTDKLGANASNITAVGHGDEMPIADNKTATGRTQNRRVVAIIQD